MTLEVCAIFHASRSPERESTAPLAFYPTSQSKSDNFLSGRGNFSVGSQGYKSGIMQGQIVFTQKTMGVAFLPCGIRKTSDKG